MEAKKKGYSDLVAIEGHKNFYRNPKSGIIYYKKGPDKFSTGEIQILRAKKEVDVQLKVRQSGMVETQARRELIGVTNPKLSEIWPELFEKRKARLEASTQIKYRVGWEIGIAPFWADIRAHEIPKNIEPYRDWYLKNFPARHFEKTYIFLKMLFRYCVETGVLKSMPDTSILKEINVIVKKNARAEKVGRVYSSAEVESILSAIKTKFDGEKLTRGTLGVLLGVRCGLRKMEALSLRWEDIFFQKNNLRVWSKKNHKWRIVPIVREVLEAFAAQREHSENSEWVFPMKSDPTRHISGQLFDKVWIQAKKAAGVQGKARFHDLRHTFATWTAEAGWPVVVACEVLDQSVKIYSKTYCHTSPEVAAKYMNRLFDNMEGTK